MRRQQRMVGETPRKSIVACDHLGLEANRERQICRIVNGDARTQSQRVCVRQQAANGHGFNSDDRKVGR